MVTDVAPPLAQQLVGLLAARKLKITTAESCTGGLIAAAITDISGSSEVFDQGVVSYANSAKVSLLGVGSSTLSAHGAVSEEIAKQMASGARKAAGADIAISATGIAGPTGGSESKPVGLVYIGVSTKNETKAVRHQFSGDRASIRAQSVQAALKLALQIIQSDSH